VSEVSSYRPLPKESVERLDFATTVRSKSVPISRQLRNEIQALLQELVQYPMPDEGDIVAGARLVSVVGQGAFGVVWKAKDLETGLDVAVKVFRNERLAVELALHQFRRGIRIMRRLSESKEAPRTVVRFLRSDAADTAFVMEYVPHLDLALNISTWDISARLQTFRLVCEAVAFAHSKGVVHRDIRPQNILVRSDATPVLADFDIADFTFLTKNTQLSPGTVLYSAPEQLAGDVGPRTPTVDIFSLGRLLQFLLLRRDPLVGVRTLEDHSGYDEVLSGALDHDPARRPQSVTELLELVPQGLFREAAQSEQAASVSSAAGAARRTADLLWADAVQLASRRQFRSALTKADKAIKLIQDIDYNRCDDWQRESDRWKVATGERSLSAHMQEAFHRYLPLRMALLLGGVAICVLAALPLLKILLGNPPPPPTTPAPPRTPPGPTGSHLQPPAPTASLAEPPPSPQPLFDDPEEPKAALFVLDYSLTHEGSGSRGHSPAGNQVLLDLGTAGYKVDGSLTADEAHFPDKCRRTAGFYRSTNLIAGSPNEQEIRRIVENAYQGSRIAWAEAGGESRMKTVESRRKTAHVLILPSAKCGR
jgi:serine/threonine protein kinase